MTVYSASSEQDQRCTMICDASHWLRLVLSCLAYVASYALPIAYIWRKGSWRRWDEIRYKHNIALYYV